jgi:hypothetical protein
MQLVSGPGRKIMPSRRRGRGLVEGLDEGRRGSLRLIRARLTGAKYRCEHASGKNAAYRGVAFEFTSAAEGARLLYEKFGPIPPGASLDRIDPAGPYSLDNLR